MVKRTAAGLAIALVGLFVLATGAASAATGVGHPYLFSFDGSETSAGSFGTVAGLAVDRGNGNVYVATRGGAIAVFDADGDLLRENAFPGTEITGQDAIAVDSTGGATDGNVYVVDWGFAQDNPDHPTGGVHVYDRAGNHLRMMDGSNIPAGRFRVPSGVAVDGSGNVYVATDRDRAIHKFSSTGNYVMSIEDSARLTNPSAVSVDSAGNVYARVFSQAMFRTVKYSPAGDFLGFVDARFIDFDPGSGDSYSFAAAEQFTGLAASKYVQQRDAAGDLLSRFGASQLSTSALYIQYNDASERVYVADVTGGVPEIRVFGPAEPVTLADVVIDPVSNLSYFGATFSGTVDPQGVPTEFHFEYRRTDWVGGWQKTPTESVGSDVGAVPVDFDVSGLTANRKYEVRLIATNTEADAEAASGVEVFDPVPVPVPDLTLEPPSAITASSLHLDGTVDPRGFATEWRVEVGGREVSGSLEAVEGPQQIEADIGGLQPNTTYQVTLTATNAGGTESLEASFKTAAVKPDAMTRFVAPRTQTTARLNGFVNARNAATDFHFEYVTEAVFQATEFDGEVARTDSAEAGVGNDQKLVSAEVSGLEPGTAYRYRLIAENVAGESVAEPLAFSTRGPAEAGPPDRGIELVNNPEKGNQDAVAKAMSADGSKVLWSVLGGAPGSSSGRDGIFLAERTGSGPTGWASRSVLPPVEEIFGGGRLGFNLLFHTPDLSSYLFDGIQGLLGVSSHRLIGLSPDGSQSVSAEVSSAETAFGMAISPTGDLGHWFALVGQAFDSSHPGSSTQVYDFSVDPPRLASRMPGSGQPPACGVGTVGSAPPFGVRPYPSATTEGDDAKFFFHSQGDSCTEPAQLYVRDMDDSAAELISGPALSGPLGGAALIRASARGDEALFVTATRLDADDANDSNDIYRWREDGATECLTCVVPEAAVQVAGSETWLRPEKVYASEDLSYAYFFSDRQLEQGVEKSGLYVLHGGEVRFVAEVFDLVPGGLSGDGRTVLLDGRGGGITTDPAELPEFVGEPPVLVHGSSRIYRYDDGDRSLECVSCRPDGITKAQFGDAHLTATGSRTPAGEVGRTISADGESVAFTTADPLVEEDINGAPDVYEWRHSRVRLVTDGETVAQGLAEAQLMGISDDAATVLFGTAGKLTGHERDSMVQLFAARLGGGFAPPAPPSPPCNEESCQGPLTPAPPVPATGSLHFSGPGTKAQPRPKAKKRPRSKACPKGKRRQKSRGKVRCVKVKKGKAKSGKSKAKQRRNGKARRGAGR